MIAPAKRNDSESGSRLHASKFEALLPRIQQQAKRAFRRCPPEAREEAVAEVVAHAWVYRSSDFRCLCNVVIEPHDSAAESRWTTSPVSDHPQ